MLVRTTRAPTLASVDGMEANRENGQALPLAIGAAFALIAGALALVAIAGKGRASERLKRAVCDIERGEFVATLLLGDDDRRGLAHLPRAKPHLSPPIGTRN